jgi:hypothetical protein
MRTERQTQARDCASHSSCGGSASACLDCRRGRRVSGPLWMLPVFPGCDSGCAVYRALFLMAARKALGDSGRAQRVIKTVHGRGYRFIAPVEECIDDVRNPVEDHAEAAIPDVPSLKTQKVPTVNVRLCRTCLHENSLEALFCVTCGTRLPHAGGSCGQVVHMPAAFCPVCGQRLASPPYQPSPTTISTAVNRNTSGGERKQEHSIILNRRSRFSTDHASFHSPLAKAKTVPCHKEEKGSKNQYVGRRMIRRLPNCFSVLCAICTETCALRLPV